MIFLMHYYICKDLTEKLQPFSLALRQSIYLLFKTINIKHSCALTSKYLSKQLIVMLLPINNNFINSCKVQLLTYLIIHDKCFK